MLAGVGIAAVLALFALRDGDSTGRPTTWAELRTIDAHSLSFVGGDPARVLFGHHQGVFASTDGGRTWDLLGPGRDAMQMAPAGNASILISGHDVFAASTDGGQTWTDVEHDLPGTDIHGFARDPLNPDHMWAYLAGGGVYESSDGGHRWREVYSDDILFLQAVARGGTVRLLGVDLSGLVQSEDGGRSWVPTGQPPDFPISSLTTNPAGTVMLMGTPSGLYRSDDGRSWAKTAFTEQPFAIAATNDGQTIAAVTRFGSYYRSHDGGRTWPGP